MTVALRFIKPVWIEDVVVMIESSASSELYALLKRQDEKAVTERAYENPVFVEDLVRNVALKLNAHPQVKWYKVEAENFAGAGGDRLARPPTRTYRYINGEAPCRQLPPSLSLAPSLSTDKGTSCGS